MKILTIKQRQSHYKKALKLIEGDDYNFICLALTSFNKTLYNTYSDNDIKDYLLLNYPELCSFKPKRKQFCQSWWSCYTKKSKEKRIDVLKQCIKLTK